VGIDDDLEFVGAQTISTSTGNLTIDTAGTLVISDATDLNNTLSVSGDITFDATTPNIAINDTESLTITDGTNTLFTLADAGTTGNLTLTGNLDVEGFGAYGNGSALDADETLIVNRAFTAAAGNSAYQLHLLGNITENTSGTHATIAPLAIDAITVTDGAGTEVVTNLASLYIAGAPTAGTTPTNGPYSIFADAGTSRFDGTIEARGTVAIDLVTLGNRIDLDADNDTSIRASADDQIDLEILGTDEYIFTAGVFDIGNGTLSRIDFDADNDTSIRSSADDQLDIELGTVDHIVLRGVGAAAHGSTVNIEEIAFTTAAHGSGTNVDQGLVIDAEIGNATAGTNTTNLLQIDAITGDAQVTLNAVNIGALTGTAATEYALNIGSGWDRVLSVNGTEVINGSGQVVSTQITGTLFTAAGDSGGGQAIAQGNTLSILGDTSGIDTADSATDTVTISFDSTEVGTTTWGSGTGFTWTFNAGTTDPLFTFGDNALTIGGAATVTATDVTTFNCTDCIDFDDLSDTLSLDTDTSITAGTGEEITYAKSFTNATTENGFVMNFTASDTTSGTTAQYGLYLDNLASTEGIDALIVIDNSDTDDSVAAGILFQDAGGTFVTGIDMNTEIITNIGNAGTDFDTSGGLTLAADLAVNGDDITSDGDLTINPAGGDLFLADGDTIVIGGLTGVAYNAISDSGTATTAASDDDLYVEDILEVDGTFDLDGAADFAGTITWTGNVDIVIDADAATPIDIGADVFASGTLIDLAYDTAETLTGDTIGLAINLNTNVTGGADDDLTGIQLQTPALTSSGTTTTNYYGYRISAAGALDTTAAESLVTNINWYGNYIQMPNIDTGESGEPASTSPAAPPPMAEAPKPNTV